ARPTTLRRLMETLAIAARRHWLIVVPGGGSFADEVRRGGPRGRLRGSGPPPLALPAPGPDRHLLPRLPPRPVVLRGRRELAPGRLSVLAPSAWLLQADPLPHSWDVTSDSIAAWTARTLGVRRLMLVKHDEGFIASDLARRARRAALAALGDMVDPYFV